jgi:mono/diheme cytochrome c family protein
MLRFASSAPPPLARRPALAAKINWRHLFVAACARRSAAFGAALVVLAGGLSVPLAAARAESPPADVVTDDADEQNPYRQGLVARYQGTDHREHVGLAEQISFAWHDRAPDRRVPRGAFVANFHGRLQVQSPGVHRLRLFAAGAVRLSVNGQVLLEAHSPQPAWHDAPPIELPFGYQELEIGYRRSDEPARLSLYWEGPGFQLEPVAARWLHHEATQTPSDEFQQGARLVRALRCQACHDLPGEGPAIPAPALDHLSGNVSREWLVERLGAREQAREGSPHRNMPHFQFTPAEVECVADYVVSMASEIAAPPAVRPATPPPPPKKHKKRNQPEPAAPVPDAARGATLVRSLGCLACHRLGPLGSDSRFGGGDLSHIADKRPAGFFRRWLDNPAALNRDHRMPVFALEPWELESLSLYLQTLGGHARRAEPPAKPQTDQGRALVAAARCAACHALDAQFAKLTRAPVPLNLKKLAADGPGCLSANEPGSHRPSYRVSRLEAKAIATFLSQLPAGGEYEPLVSGQDLLVERNCLACHARDTAPGLSGQMPAIAAADESLAPVLAALTPPPLTSVGDKLHDAELDFAINVAQPPRRTWLHVRMPRFPFATGEARRIAEHLVAVDRIAELPQTARGNGTTDSEAAAQEAAGPRLVTADGFGCTSCHAIGKWQPPKVALNAQGADLSQLGHRIRRSWFERWVRNPARIVPQMEMPSVQQAVRGVLAGHLDQQLSAVWRVLNRPDFTPPSPSALRVVRRSNRTEAAEPAAVLTDVVEVDGKPFVKPLIVGLANRHNVLFDLASARLAGWWLGDVARQQTRGKSWYWEAGVPQLLDVEKPDPERRHSELQLIDGDHLLEPVTAGDYLTEFDRVEHITGGVQFEYRLRLGTSADPRCLRAAQAFTAWKGAQGAEEGLERTVRIDGLPAGVSCQLLTLPGDVSVDDRGRVATLVGRVAEVHVQLVEPEEARLIRTERGAAVTLPAQQGQAACTLRYRSEVAADQFASPPALDRSLELQALEVVPGFTAVRLPTTDEAMPTGLAWRPDGTLVVCSLEGRVWLGRDGNGDGLVDRLDPFSDELAAPFGAAAAGEAIDVINKYGLLRLTDADHDGHAERIERLVSGWGHTRDYHDWAIGLPRDEDGNYYVSLPCQQDERTAAGALLRGTVVALVPRRPTADDPSRFAIEQLCAGLRFPQGIALSPGRDLFVTDHQGNYTPFNELNHVVRGARYGFINRLENKPGFQPSFRPAAVEIPHPWTRSVNGICFLALAGGADQPVADTFGPFAGHVIGCEYETRRLVRMTLERVAGEYQGAVYPFSSEPPAGASTFEGPLSCGVGPSGDIYIGNIRDSGWGAGTNTGSLVRLRYSGQPAPGIAEVRCVREGFRMTFTAPVDPSKARDPANYSIDSYRRIPTPDYGGPDRDRRVERVRAVELSDDALQATLAVGELREGFVYEFHVRNLTHQKTFFPAEAYYTLRHAVR